MAKNTKWDTSCITLSGTAVTFTIKNEDRGIAHNLNVMGAPGTSKTDLVPGIATQTLALKGLTPGKTYTYVCDLHPSMIGELKVMHRAARAEPSQGLPRLASSPAPRPTALAAFSEPVGRGSRQLPRAHRAQAQGWPAIAAGDHTLILAPTGSGKTLAAFLWGIDRLVTHAAARRPQHAHPRCSTSRRCGPSRSTSRRTCGRPLRGHRAWPPSGSGHAACTRPTVGIRTGDTPADERRRLRAQPARPAHHHARVALPACSRRRPARRCAASRR